VFCRNINQACSVLSADAKLELTMKLLQSLFAGSQKELFADTPNVIFSLSIK